ncbi:hypothetical protein GCM10027079_17150 [Sediminivirga luteola]|uniref:Large ribosomal subunit protein bL36 n=1 Tax=Sediminivirga luteola TaxID=1774748 RepID=A0A8J2XJD2_9MICO|nr:hypothetical protein GCM10011333_04610 [Sediminivirga luteola]
MSEDSYSALCAVNDEPQGTQEETEREMKVRNSLRSLKNQPGSQIVRRRGRTYVINKKNPRLKARQG